MEDFLREYFGGGGVEYSGHGEGRPVGGGT